MKKIFVTFFLMNLIINAQAQKKPGATASGGSAPASSGSGASQLIQGFHYKLKPMHHLRYLAYQKGKEPVGYPVDKPVKITDSWITYQITPSADNKSFTTASVKFGTSETGSKDKLARPDIRDTLWRYSKTKLWMSVTQGDSGKLAIQFISRVQKVKPIGVVAADEFTPDIILADIHIARYSDGGSNAAIPIRGVDSAQNFYLKIGNKKVIDQPIYFISLPYSVWQYGATTIPFRYRFANSNKKISLPNAAKVATEYNVPSEATANISLAGYLGHKFGSTRFFYDATKSHNTVSGMFSAFAGPTLVSLSANNVNSGTDLNMYPSQILAFSTGVSLTVEFGSLNLGLFSGVDLPLQRSPWVYSGQLWIGFGIGINLGMLTSGGNIGL